MISSPAIPARVKAALTLAMAIVVTSVLRMHGSAALTVTSVLGELCVGMIFGLSLALVSDIVMFAISLIGMEFSFSLVHLINPVSQIETPVMGQLLGWVSTLVLLGAGLHRTLISAVLRSTASPASVAVPASSSRLRGTSPPRLSRVSPASHIKQVFSSRSLIRLAKSLVPASVVVMLGWHLLQQVLRDTPVLGLDRLPATLGKAYGLGMKAALVMVVWAAIDYAVERRAWNHRLRMSKQHVRQEMKEQLGNPQMKGKIRQLW